RSISRIKSSSRHEVTIPNPVFRCSEFGGVTALVKVHLDSKSGPELAWTRFSQGGDTVTTMT
ncbi:hypothetical protein Tco_0082140, partial [Tanacetum coccineum]